MVNEFDKENREELGKMSVSDRLIYFRDYYLVKILIITGVAVLFAVLFISFLSPQKGYSLYVAVVDTKLDKTEKDDLIKKISSEIGCKPSEVHMDDKFHSTSADDMSSFDVLCANNAVDVLIAPKEIFKHYAGQGYFISTSQMGWNVPKNRSVILNGILEADSKKGYDEDEAGKGKKCPYGVSLKDISTWSELSESDGDYVLGVITGSKHLKNSGVLFRMLIFGDK